MLVRLTLNLCWSLIQKGLVLAELSTRLSERFPSLSHHRAGQRGDTSIISVLNYNNVQNVHTSTHIYPSVVKS